MDYLNKIFKNKRRWFDAIVVLILLYIQQFQMSYSATVGLKNNLTIALPWVLLNMLIVALPFFIVLTLVKRVHRAILVNIFIFAILSVANYHVLLYHGSPFLAGDIFSIPTAMNVISEYAVVFDNIVKRLFLITAIEIVIWVLYYYVLPKNKSNNFVKRKNALIYSIACALCILIFFFSPFAILKKSTFAWSWGNAMNQYGYGVSFCNSLYIIMNHYSEPDNYNAEKITCEDSDFISQVSDEELPDIILILNETLADLNVYLELQESNSIFEKIRSVEGMVSGYTVSSLIGGGTNNSEYELLTSNSMQVLNVSAPFLSLDMTKSPSIVSHLEKINYTTSGMHCGNASNYNRSQAYAQLGFDNVYLGKESFDYYNENGNRPWLDSDNYRDMIELYETCGDEPRFMYLLTYQNHGGYEQNDTSQDMISVKGDYGNYTDDINEYLTSVDKSVESFLNLIQYFQNSERKVVIMMLGDHMPAFITGPVSRFSTK